jgi:glycosyltransferase 2 family protein
LISNDKQEATPRKRFPSWLLPAIGYAVSLASLYWVYQGFDWKEQLPRVARTDLRWVSLAMLSDIAVYVCQGARWRYLLQPLAHVTTWKATQAVYIGIFANEVLPLRTGEIIRIYLMRKWSGLPLPVVFSSAVIERLMDGIWLVVCFYAATLLVNLPGWLEGASHVLMLVLAAIAALVLWAVLHKSHAHAAVKGSRWGSMLRHVVDGVHDMGRSRSFLISFLVSGLHLALQVIPLWALMKGFQLDRTLWEAAAVLAVLRIGTILPQAPGNVGSFQALVLVGLGALGVDRGTATGFATLLFFVITVPLWMAGFVALMLTRMRLTDLQRDAQREELT